MSDRDYYEILGLMPGADGAMVDQAYWHTARKYQTAAVADPRAREQLDDLNEAYGVLGTPRLRAQYDAFRDDVLEAQTGGKRRRHPTPEPRSQERDAPGRGMFAALRTSVASLGKRVPAVHITLPSALTDESREAMVPTIERESSWESSPAAADVRVRREEPLSSRAHGRRTENSSANEIQASTAAMINRWRNSVGLQAPVSTVNDPSRDPDTTLVDIFQSEQDIEGQNEPLTAVIDILRGSRQTTESR